MIKTRFITYIVYALALIIPLLNTGYSQGGVELHEGSNPVVYSGFFDSDNSIGSVFDYSWFSGEYPYRVLSDDAMAMYIPEMGWMGSLQSFSTGITYWIEIYGSSYYDYPFVEHPQGCTDPDACNYCDYCTYDDGNCLSDDCTGDCGGLAYIDDCDVCSGGGSGHVANSDMNACGECFASPESCDLQAQINTAE